MRVAIIGGSGVYTLGEGEFEQQTITTPYGAARLFVGRGEWEDFVFLPRHGPEHTIPPHRINYRANIKALAQLGVERILATFAVGSLQRHLPPRSLVALDQFMDFTHGREGTFFEGGRTGLAHLDVTEPYCAALRAQLLALAPRYGLNIHPRGTYVCTNGPRFETAAEVRMYARLGGDVVGMTGVPEVVLARELGIHYAAVALSINWAAGLEGGTVDIVREGVAELRATLLALFVEVLRTPLTEPCDCESALLVIHPPTP